MFNTTFLIGQTEIEGILGRVEVDISLYGQAVEQAIFLTLSLPAG